MNFINVNIFKKSDDPSTLLESAEWSHISFPLKNLTLGPRCVNLTAEPEKKAFAFCFKNSEIADKWIQAGEILKMCRKGMSIQDAMKNVKKCMQKINNKDADKDNTNDNDNNKDDNDDEDNENDEEEEGNYPSLFNQNKDKSNKKKKCANCPKKQ